MHALLTKTTKAHQAFIARCTTMLLLWPSAVACRLYKEPMETWYQKALFFLCCFKKFQST